MVIYLVHLTTSSGRVSTPQSLLFAFLRAPQPTFVNISKCHWIKQIITYFFTKKWTSLGKIPLNISISEFGMLSV
jgi:hypothetical protein